jgi:hypothetical protein
VRTATQFNKLLAESRNARGASALVGSQFSCVSVMASEVGKIAQAAKRVLDARQIVFDQKSRIARLRTVGGMPNESCACWKAILKSLRDTWRDLEAAKLNEKSPQSGATYPPSRRSIGAAQRAQHKFLVAFGKPKHHALRVWVSGLLSLHASCSARSFQCCTSFKRLSGIRTMVYALGMVSNAPEMMMNGKYQNNSDIFASSSTALCARRARTGKTKAATVSFRRQNKSLRNRVRRNPHDPRINFQSKSKRHGTGK